MTHEYKNQYLTHPYLNPAAQGKDTLLTVLQGFMSLI